MSSLGRRQIVWGGVGASALVAAYLVFGPSDQRNALNALREVVLSPRAVPGDTEALRRARVQAALAKYTLPSFTLSLPEFGIVEGHPAILKLLEQAQGLSIDIAIEQSDVVVEGNTCQATLLVAVTFSTPGERRRQVRTLSCELVRNSEPDFRLTRLNASEASREQPEARP